MREKKNTKSRIVLICGTFACLALVALAAFMLKPADAEAKNVKNKTVTLKVGQKYQLTAFNIGSKIKWTSSKKKVASVSKKGVVKAKKAGITKITAKGTRGKVSCKIKVKAKKKKSTKKKATATAKPTGTTAQSTVANSEYAKNIVVTTTMLDDTSIICTLQNNNKATMKEVKVALKLYNAEGTVMGTDDMYFYNVIGNGATTYGKVIFAGEKQGFDASKTNAVVTIPDYSTAREFSDPNKYLTAKEYNADNKKTTLTFNNPTAKKLYIDGYYEYRDAAGKLVGIYWIYASVDAGSATYSNAYDPINASGEYIPYTTTAFVGNAYSYAN